MGRTEAGGRAKQEREEAKGSFPSTTVHDRDKGAQAGGARGHGKPWHGEQVAGVGLKAGGAIRTSQLYLNECRRRRFERCHLL
jgi:hypothetical protein